jgi:1,4-alpha-glucan branching enzyme
MDVFHIDGLRVDAVASMLYLDYCREPGEWVKNEYGGRENIEAVLFLKELNEVIYRKFPTAITIAEESTDWGMVSQPTYDGGLGFTYKWNMGWMHDTLRYIKQDPIYRKYNHKDLTFGMLYFYNENFVLPISHDEVVHGKSSLIGRMPGDEWQRFANLRVYLTMMMTYPGKKTLFMGCEFGQYDEWKYKGSLDWHLNQYSVHKGAQLVTRDLNHLYKDEKSLYEFDNDPEGFQWIECNDAENSVLSYIRKSDEEHMVVALNFTPVIREEYRLGVPEYGYYKEVFNSDSEYYSGSNVGNLGLIHSDKIPMHGFDYSIKVCLPPLAGIILKRK